MMAAKIQQFWDWFLARAGQVRRDPRKSAPEISDMLHRLHPGLSWEIGNPGDGAFEFVIRTEDSSLRYLAHQVVAGAPKMEQWRMSSWRQPAASTTLVIQVGQGRKFKVADFSASLEPHARFPLLRAVVTTPPAPGPTAKSDTYAGFLALDALLGEKLVEDCLDSIDFRSSPPGPVEAARLNGEVRRLLAELRARPAPPSEDKWSLMEGKKDGVPFVALVATDIEASLMPSHPWRIDVIATIREPLPNGLPRKEELEALNPVEDRLLGLVQSGNRGLIWTFRTHHGTRTNSFYVSEPAGLEERLIGELGLAGWQGKAVVEYDPRWRAMRAFIEK